jgi:hypothetical protein
MINDMPGDLREKLQLWDVLNKILKNNGYIDSNAILNNISNLKEKLNVILTEVLVEHDLDNIHNYDDSKIKDTLAELTEKLNTMNGHSSIVGTKTPFY